MLAKQRIFGILSGLASALAVWAPSGVEAAHRFGRSRFALLYFGVQRSTVRIIVVNVPADKDVFCKVQSMSFGNLLHVK